MKMHYSFKEVYIVPDMVHIGITGNVQDLFARGQRLMELDARKTNRPPA